MQTKYLIPASNGRKIPLWVMHPDGIDLSSRENILLFSMHGIGERSNDTDTMNWLDYLRDNGPVELYKDVQKPFKGKNFILIAPQLSKYDNGLTEDNRNWTWPAWYIKTVYDWAMSKFGSDPQRCALTGLSQGGGGAQNFITYKKEYASLFSSVIICCGVNSLTGGWENIVNARLPVAYYHAKDDNVVDYYGHTLAAYNSIQALKPEVKPALISQDWGGHGIWNTVYDMERVDNNVFDFIINNKFISPVGAVIEQTPTPLPVPQEPAVKKSGVGAVVSPELSFPAGTKTITLDASKSIGGKGYWETVSKPSTAWLSYGATYGVAIVNGMQDGTWVFRFTDQDDYGKRDTPRDVKVTVGGGTSLIKKIISYLVTPIFSDGTQDAVKSLKPGEVLPA